MSPQRWFVAMDCFFAALFCVGIAWVWGNPPREQLDAKPSSYAPAKDLEYQVAHLLERIKGDLRDETRYERRVKRVVRDANTIVALSLVMANHDQRNGLQQQAAAVMAAASELAARAGCHADARAAFATLVAATQTPAHSPAVPWERVGDIEQLMLQVPELERDLKVAIKPAHFANSRDRAASFAATLAAISQVSMFDDKYCRQADDLDEWMELCVLMRDAAKDVHSAIENGDPDAAERSLKPLARTCTECHDRFRP